MLKPVCVILAGGRSRRMGHDKALALLAGKPLIAHVLERLVPQAAAVLINSNSGDPALGQFGIPVLGDTKDGHLGPLAGLLTGLRWARELHPDASHLLSASCDTPFLPHDLVLRLVGARDAARADIAIASDGVHPHGTVGLWPLWLADRLEADLMKGVRAIHAWLADFRVAETVLPGQALCNINTHAELDQAANRMTETTAHFEKA